MPARGRAARRAVETFCRALAYHWVLYGPDAHAKQLLRWVQRPPENRPTAAAAPRRPSRPRVDPYRKSDGSWVSGYDNPRFRG